MKPTSSQRKLWKEGPLKSYCLSTASHKRQESKEFYDQPLGPHCTLVPGRSSYTHRWLGSTVNRSWRDDGNEPQQRRRSVWTKCFEILPTLLVFMCEQNTTDLKNLWDVLTCLPPCCCEWIVWIKTNWNTFSWLSTSKRASPLLVSLDCTKSLKWGPGAVFEEVLGAALMCDISHRALWKLACYPEYCWLTYVGKEDITKRQSAAGNRAKTQDNFPCFHFFFAYVNTQFLHFTTHYHVSLHEQKPLCLVG